MKKSKYKIERTIGLLLIGAAILIIGSIAINSYKSFRSIAIIGGADTPTLLLLISQNKWEIIFVAGSIIIGIIFIVLVHAHRRSNDKILLYYQRLPVSMPAKECNRLFIDAINRYNCDEIDKYLFLDILEELTDRYVYTYEIMPEEIKEKIEKCLYDLWDIESYTAVEAILYIIVNLGLQNIYDKIKIIDFDNEKISPEIKKEIEDTIKECGDDISNPYRDLENQHIKD